MQSYVSTSGKRIVGGLMLRLVRRYVSELDLERLVEERCRATVEIDLVEGIDNEGVLKMLPALAVPDDLAARVMNRELATKTRVNVDFASNHIFVYVQIEWPDIMDAIEFWIEGKWKNYLPLTILCSQKALVLTSQRCGSMLVDGFNTQALKILCEQW